VKDVKANADISPGAPAVLDCPVSHPGNVGQTRNSIRTVRAQLQQLRAYTTESPEILHNIFALGLIQVATYTLPLITLPYVLRVVGIQRYGVLAFASSFIAYLVILTDYGFRLSAPRAISVHRDDPVRVSAIFSAVVLIKLLLLLISSVVLWAGLRFMPDLGVYRIVAYYTFGLVIANALSVTWLFQGMERMKYITYLSLGSKLLYTVLLFTFIRKGADFIYIPLLSSVTEVLAGAIGITIAVNAFKVRLVFSRYECVTTLREGWHTFVSSVSINAYTVTPVFAVGLFGGPRLAGCYSVAERLASLFQTFPIASVLQALYPRLSNIYSRKPLESYRVMMLAQHATTFVYVISLPVLLAVSPFAIHLVTNSTSPETITSFRLLAIGVVCINANAFRVQFLLVSGRHNVYSRIHMCFGVAGSGAVFLGAYFFSYVGPAVGLIVVNVSVLLWTQWEVSRQGPYEQLVSVPERAGRIFSKANQK
jgi:PST family polysaccharide transporter